MTILWNLEFHLKFKRKKLSWPIVKADAVLQWIIPNI